MFKIEITEELSNFFPDLKIGYVIADVKISHLYDNLLEEIKATTNEIEKSMTVVDVRENSIIKSTKNAYRKLGKDPNRYRPSAESLLRRVVQGKGLYKINNVVDLLNLLSITSGFSICGYDYEKIEGGICFQIGKNEIYEGIGRGELNIEDLPVFADSCGVFGSPTSDSVKTMIDDKTSKILFLFPLFEKFDAELEDVISKCVQLLNQYDISKNIIKGIVS